jgi:DNA-binding SARP family transcriptional activator
MLRLSLFGAPRLEQGGQNIPLRRTKALALMVYLATTRQPQDRDALLALLWPEFDEASARNNLRRELSLLKTMLGEEQLIADRHQIAWNSQADVWLDVAAFQAQITIHKQHDHAADELCDACAAALAVAAQIYTDDFMAGFGLPDSSAFDEWQFFQREGLRQQLAEALRVLARWHHRRAEYAPAIDAARRWLALDPLHEPAQRELMRLYALSGQHSAALRQYDESVRLLDRELGVEPEAETIELYEQIRSRTFPRHGDKQIGRQSDTHQEAAPSQSPNLPISQSPNLPISQSHRLRATNSRRTPASWAGCASWPISFAG